MGFFEDTPNFFTYGAIHKIRRNIYFWPDKFSWAQNQPDISFFLISPCFGSGTFENCLSKNKYQDG